MKKINLNYNFEYELLDKNQQCIGLREKLAALYLTPFADILWWELRDLSLEKNGYYKLFYYEQSILKHIILFKYSVKTQKKILVLNEEFKISLKHIENICNILFNEFEKVQQIVFEKIYETDSKQLSKMLVEWTPFNDIIFLNLPKSMDEYIKSLGTSTRKKIKLMLNRISKDFSKFKVHHFEKNNILYKQIEEVVSMNRNRMKYKGIISNLNDTECNILHEYASTSGYGYLCVCEIDGKIIGATINSVIGEHAYMHVIAHDVAYNQYAIGQIALVHATQYLIEEKNIKFYHLLSGTQEYKYRHGGINHGLFTYKVFRNKDVYYFFVKTISVSEENYRKFRRKLKDNKIVYYLFTKLNKLKMKVKTNN